MNITILGNNSAVPAFGRHPTAQAVSIDGEMVLLDCGEGTQMQMQKYSVKWRKMNYIFISHLHGDHYFGLPGLLNTMSLLGRTLPLHLYAPKELEEIIQTILEVADTKFTYPYFFHALKENESELLVDENNYQVHSFPVIHRIPCHGFIITQKTKGRKILPEKCREYEIPSYYYEKLKRGENYERADGFVVRNEWLTEGGKKEKKYAYCADTIYTETILKYISNADTIYHECTFMEADVAKAGSRFHSTAKHAAQIAKLAKVNQLLLGHYSSKYRDLEQFKTEAAEIFPNVMITEEGTIYEV